MKKLFTLALALMGFAGAANAATVDDVAVCKHSYVLVFEDQLINNQKPGKGQLFGDGYFLDLTGGTANNGGKKSVNLADETLADGKYIKYAEYGTHNNCWRLKDAQDVIVMKVTAGSKVIVFGESHASRFPAFSTTAENKEKLLENAIPATSNTVSTNGCFEWEAPRDMTVYIGSDGGDYYVSYLIVEANEPAGTPTVKVGEQTYENGRWFREVTCTPNKAGALSTVVTYTIDGTAPTATSTKYTEPIKCYKDQTIKFQAFMSPDGSTIATMLNGAENEANVSFKFDAPTINANGGNVTLTTAYGNSVNYYSTIFGSNTIVADTTDYVSGDAFTLTESAIVTAYTEINNGDGIIFKSNGTSKDVYVLNPIKETKTITVTSGKVVVDEEATKNSSDGSTVYKVEDGAINADKMDFFVKNLEFAAIATEAGLGKYQINDQEAYIKMNSTNISFEVAAGDSVAVKVVCSLNSCKDIDAEDKDSVNRQCFVNVDSKNYGGKDVTLEEDANIIEFTLGPGVHTFLKYSGTGNIMIYSIEITPMIGAGISAVAGEQSVNAPAYNLAGQKVDASYKGVVIKNGQKLIQK